MNVNLNEIVFEGKNKNVREQFDNYSSDTKEIMIQFLESPYFDNGLDIERFLEPDTTIDLEKLELAISLLIEYLNFLDNSKSPFYIFLKNIGGYFEARHIDLFNFERVTEESTFIHGFCQAVAENIIDGKEVIVLYAK